MSRVSIYIISITFIVIYLLAFLIACTPINQKMGLSDDHLGEELLEEAIKMKTGLNIDLSPSTKER